MEAAIRKVVGDAPIKPGKVKLDLPPLVENGNTVAMSVAVDSPMTAADHVKAIHVFTEKNPQPNVISVKLGPRAGRAEIATRIRLADTQTVIAICEMSDGSFWSDQRRGRSSRSPPAWRIIDLMAARTLINVPPEGQARRDHRDQDADLARHGDRLPARQRRQADPARHHHVVRLHLQRRGDLPRHALPGDRRQSVHHVPHGGDRERHHRVQMDRRQRLRREEPRRRSRSNECSSRASRWSVALLPLAAAALPPPAARDSARPSAARATRT